MSFDRDRRDRSNDDSENNERTRRARAQPQTQRGARPHQYLSSVLRPSPEQAAQLDQLIQTRGFEQVQAWGERGELPEGCNTPMGEQVRDARVRSSWKAGVELDTPSAMRSVQAQTESDLAGETATPDVVRRVISQPGRPLEGSVREEMEQRMGDSFGDVQLHTGPEAAKAASALEARAFTTGNHVVFNRGEYKPESPEGKYLLAHELAHVRQQTGGAISMLPQERRSLVVEPNPAPERDATGYIVEGSELGIQRLATTTVHVQRVDKTRREVLSGNVSTEEMTAGIEDTDLLSVGPDRLRDAYKYAEYAVTLGATQSVVQPLVSEYGLSQPEAMAVTLAVGGTIHVGKDRLHREDIYLTLEVARVLGEEERVLAFFRRIGADLPREGTIEDVHGGND
ncbi:eCIS core domain-containing protein [Natronobiforma cellulositropha]|uniref:eCIS core domain-containing protein n=1 Tax=Natronobiforma cellulositropha TaxID=1679076 RepID=UPI00294FF47D|nr:DUF4157 domain-containing protein [Natronobiforma cellulositropha]